MKKLTTLAQLNALHEGDIVTRFPCNGDVVPEDVFDASRTRNIETFRVRGINPETNMMSLVTVHDSYSTFASAVSVGRLFIKSNELISENIWWIK